MADRLTQIDDLPEIGKINIDNKNLIQFGQVDIIDNRFDNVLFSYYGNNYQQNYGISTDLLMYLVLSFNDLSNVANLSGIIKLPNIYQLLENIILVNDNNKLNGVYDVIVVNEKSNKTNSVINELQLRLNTVEYDRKTGILKF